MEDRLIALESKLAFTEDMLEALNLAVFRQQEQIDQLQQQIRLLYQQMQSNSPSEKTTSADAREDVPPHY
jgi:SlyX protein